MLKTKINLDIIQVNHEIAKNLYVIIDDIAEHEMLEVSSNFGVPIPQYNGKMLYDVKPDRKFIKMYTSKNRGPLYPHHERYETSITPDTIGLWCKNADKYGEGYTEVCDMRPFINSLPGDEFKILCTKRYPFFANEGISTQQGGREYCMSSIIDRRLPGKMKFRYSYNYMFYNAVSDPFIAQFQERVRDYYEEHKVSILLTKGQLLLFRNTLLLHSRTHFRDMERWLIRVFLADQY